MSQRENNPQGRQTWTDDHDSELKSLVEKGYSSQQIGHIIGRTRSSVIGRCHRMGLALKGGVLIKGAPPKKGGVKWTDAEDGLLRDLVNAGKSASEAANHIGKSKRACIGRAGRLGLTFKGGVSSISVNVSRSGKTVRGGHVDWNRAKAIRAELKFDPTTQGDIEPRNLSIMDLEWRDCRWPVNSPAKGEEHLFCGHKRAHGSSYCAVHHARSIGRLIAEEAA